jgi:DNA polymerase III subunit delta
MDHEIIEATVSNSGEALAAIAKLREALQTLPFFGSGKVVWLRDCNFLGDERAAVRPGRHRNRWPNWRRN